MNVTAHAPPRPRLAKSCHPEAAPRAHPVRYDRRAQTACESSSIMLINCAVYQQGRKVKDIPVEEISDYLVQPDAFVWVALVDPSGEEVDKMAEEFGLHALAIGDASKGHQRPKMEEYEDSLFVVLQTVDGLLEDGE